ncbi:MAG: divalent-cation tolerance protein CutA [Pseudomonadota bacterium]
MTHPRAALIYTLLPDVETAREIARTLVGERLIACANILGSIESIFAWQGDVQSAAEVAVIFKTTQKQTERAVKRLGALHPYATPAIVASACDTAHVSTLEWLVEQTRGQRRSSIDTE